MNNKYDITIIGSGIGGLVCGCYLSKAGLKTLIIEQHHKPGGCCTSFERRGYRFDVGVHYIGSLRRGILRQILEELEINLETFQIDPTDKIIMPDKVVYIRTKIKSTIAGLQKEFSLERKAIENFFNFILLKNPLNIYKKVNKFTFKQVLDSFFKDYKLKAILSLLVGNLGLSGSNAAAMPAIILFREYILDGGCYPAGGIQVFADKLAERFKNYNGNLLMSTKAIKIITKGPINKIILDNGDEILTDTIVSNADGTETFKKLLNIKTKEYHAVDRLIPSPSMFLLHLGLKVNLEKVLPEKSNIWYFSSYDIDKLYSFKMLDRVANSKIRYLVCSFPSMHDLSLCGKKGSTATLFIHTVYKTAKFWENNKIEIGERMIDKASEIITNLRKYIDIKVYATPVDFNHYTSNRRGALAGWLPTLDQTRSALLPQRTSVKNLYIVGQWTTTGYSGQGGIPNVAFTGKRGAMLILQDRSKKYL
jgi:all-trans-retinol 13,14-reductase